MSQQSESQITNDFAVSQISLYDFLGIPPGSPPNLIYLAIQKMENSDWDSFININDHPDFRTQIEYYLHLAKHYLLSAENRIKYEQIWISYYLPLENSISALEKFLERTQASDFFRGGLRQKSFPILHKVEDSNDDTFHYDTDFLYFIMHDRFENREIFFLSPDKPLEFTSYKKNIIFKSPNFCLQNTGGNTVTISNDAVGKILTLSKETNIDLPLHIGDRLEFIDGTRFILRSFYSQNKNSEYNIPEYYLYFFRENISLPLLPEKVYIIGRNTTDILRLPLVSNEELCFVNIGRRERSISRQNLQIFFHKNEWYIQDLGSRYGTTLDFPNHCKFETLSGGAIMKLEEGKIRLGYDKSYIINVSKEQNFVRKTQVQFKKVSEFTSLYDLAYLC